MGSLVGSKICHSHLGVETSLKLKNLNRYSFKKENPPWL